MPIRVELSAQRTPAHAAKRTETETELNTRKSRHVVVLDDSPVYAHVYGNLFESQLYRVTRLTDCAVDPATVLGTALDVLVVDLHCGAGLRGLDFVRRLRRNPAGATVPVIASTPASLVDLAMVGNELSDLGVAIFDDFGHLDALIAAVRAATG